MRTFLAALAGVCLLATPAFAQEARWASEDGRVSVAIPEGWERGRTRLPDMKFYVHTRERGPLSACSVSMPALRAMDQESANQLAGRWARTTAAGQSDSDYSEERVGDIAIVAVGGGVEEDGVSYREGARLFIVGGAEGSSGYLIHCRVDAADETRLLEANRFLNSVTINAGTTQ